MTPLHYAASTDKLPLVSILLEWPDIRRASLYHKDTRHRTPMDYAAESAPAEIFIKLLEALKMDGPFGTEWLMALGTKTAQSVARTNVDFLVKLTVLLHYVPPNQISRETRHLLLDRFEQLDQGQRGSRRNERVSAEDFDFIKRCLADQS